jgi:hypothetical protein
MLANFAATVLPCMWKLQCTLENWKKILYCITRNAEVIKLLSQEQEEQRLLLSPLRRFIHPFIHQRLYSPLLGPGLFFSSVIFLKQSVGLLKGRSV